jgi:hypothetical protein
MDAKRAVLMRCKKSYDKSQDIHSRDYHSPKKATAWRNAVSWLRLFLGSDNTEAAWRLKLEGKIDNDDFLGELLVLFAEYYRDNQLQRVGKKPQVSAPQVKAIVMLVLQILRTKKIDFPSGQTLHYHTFDGLLLHSESFCQFWDQQRNLVNPKIGTNPAYPRDRAKLGEACSPFPSGLALCAFIHTAPFAATKVHSLNTW